MPDSEQRPAPSGLPPDWADATHRPDAFEAEQKRFAHVWTFLGLTTDVEREGDWFRASIGARSVFVQRIRGVLKGFENRCAHRFFPLRVADKGNGPIVCGFHHWRYDDEGRALGIPVCEAVFGVVSRQLNAGLTRIDVAVCGTLVFGRFPAPEATSTLEDYLGDCFPILEALSRTSRRPYHFARPVEAHWKLCMHIAVDDYHLAAVHPTTFGKGGNYLDRGKITYTRIGPHSIYQSIGGPDAFVDMRDSLMNGTAQSDHYIVVHLMPGLVLSHAHVWDGYYVCGLTHFAPVSHHRSMQRTWIYPSPLGLGAGRLPRVLHAGGLDAVLLRIACRYGKFILGEDAQASERLQTNASTFTGSVLIGRLEERVQWYETAYREIMTKAVSQARS
jgi:phenylpropionate dioxygenase-like ring-hydroxylating dioxygenase large terminal subunit